jgi:zinc protease
MQDQKSPQKKSALDGFAKVRELAGIEEYTLVSNGMRVLLKEDHSAPVAGVMVTYHVGSRNETTGYTGATHLLEHLMFKGSDNFNKDNKKTVWHLLETKGAQVNATTWMDRTNYYEVIPSEYIEDSISLEADRMRNAWIEESDRQSEMTVVRNEFERGENSPLQAVDKQLWALAFQAHPYHHSTIGWRSDIEKVPIERLKKFYNDFYWPNNATVTIVGDFDKEKTLLLVQEHFGRHGRSPHVIVEPYTEEPKQEGERRAVIKRAHTSNLVAVGYKVPSIASEDTPALHVLNILLEAGKTGRLQKALVDTSLCSSVENAYFPMRDETLFGIYATLTPGTSHEKVEKVIKNELKKIGEKVSLDEVKKAKRAVRVALASIQDGAYSLLSYLNEYLAGGDWTRSVTIPGGIEKVTPADVMRVARTYFVEDQGTVGWFVGVEAGKKKGASRKRKTR